MKILLQFRKCGLDSRLCGYSYNRHDDSCGIMAISWALLMLALLLVSVSGTGCTSSGEALEALVP
jgi:hypothetical protein